MPKNGVDPARAGHPAPTRRRRGPCAPDDPVQQAEDQHPEWVKPAIGELTIGTTPPSTAGPCWSSSRHRRAWTRPARASRCRPRPAPRRTGRRSTRATTTTAGLPPGDQVPDDRARQGAQDHLRGHHHHVLVDQATGDGLGHGGCRRRRRPGSCSPPASPLGRARSTLVATTVAMELAVSWKPLMNSNTRAARITSNRRGRHGALQAGISCFFSTIGRHQGHRLRGSGRWLFP